MDSIVAKALGAHRFLQRPTNFTTWLQLSNPRVARLRKKCKRDITADMLLQAIRNRAPCALSAVHRCTSPALTFLAQELLANRLSAEGVIAKQTKRKLATGPGLERKLLTTH